MSEERFREVFRRITSETPDAPGFADLEITEAKPKAPLTFQPWMVAVGAALIVMVVVGAFGLLAGGGPDLAPPSISATTTPVLRNPIPADCPATIVTEGFVPPEGYAPERSDGKIWYGTDELWTAIPANGISDYQKSVWWSTNFPGSSDEPKPEIEVTFRRLGREPETIVNADATVAKTPADGSHMSVGFQPDIQGCWEVTARYKGDALRYIYFSPNGRPLTIEVPDLIGLPAREAIDSLQELELYLWMSDSGSLPDGVVCAQRPDAGTKLRRFSSVEIATAEPGEKCGELAPTVEVPDVVGLTAEAAGRQLGIADLSGLILGFAADGAVVCVQNPEAGDVARGGDAVAIQMFLPGGCDEFLKPNGLYNRTYVDNEGREWYGTDCPGADVLIRSGSQVAGDLPRLGDTFQERIHGLLQDDAVEFSELGAKSLAVLPRIGEVWDFAENGDIVVFDGENDYMIKVTKNESFACPSAPYFWNGIPVAFMNS